MAINSNGNMNFSVILSCANTLFNEFFYIVLVYALNGITYCASRMHYMEIYVIFIVVLNPQVVKNIILYYISVIKCSMML